MYSRGSLKESHSVPHILLESILIKRTSQGSEASELTCTMLCFSAYEQPLANKQPLNKYLGYYNKLN